MINTVITGSGSYIPENEIENFQFIENPFCSDNGKRIQGSNADVIEKFQEITGIKARRYVSKDQSCSKIATLAAERAITNAGIDREQIDTIIVAHNFGDISGDSFQTDIVPSIASRVKHNLGIANPSCIPYDLIFGCPGWIQGMIQAHQSIRLGDAKTCLIIGSEVLSRVLDPFDRDTMIFADGAGAVILEARDEKEERGILSYAVASHTQSENNYLYMGDSFNQFDREHIKYIKMKGHRIYQYALSQVPLAMKQCLDKAKLDIDRVSKILIHQANEKMDEAIINRFYKLHDRTMPQNIMPMIIERLGNSSVATVPTLYDMIMNGMLPKHRIASGDYLIMASVGAGMNINALVYKA